MIASGAAARCAGSERARLGGLATRVIDLEAKA
jgi:hypothetical protein